MHIRGSVEDPQFGSVAPARPIDTGTGFLGHLVPQVSPPAEGGCQPRAGALLGLPGQLGAVQTRFESTISNLQVTSENLAGARSRIRDADFAAETAELTRTQILQQAGISILAQANALPQNVLGLLQ